MQRDPAPASRFAGTYRFDLSASHGDRSHASSVTITLDVAPTGVALLSGGTDTAVDGVVRGTVTSGRCAIADGGSLSCNALYLVEHSDDAELFRLTGKLTAAGDGVTGVGRYLAGVDPPYDIYVPGGWTAARESAPRVLFSRRF